MESAHTEALEELLVAIKLAALEGRRYTLCVGCTVREAKGQLAVQGCRVIAAQLKNRDGAWNGDNLALVCCFVAQQMRYGAPYTPQPQYHPKEDM
jgi:hypothetical protein